MKSYYGTEEATREELLRKEAEEYGKRYVAQRNALFARQLAETIVVEN